MFPYTQPDIFCTGFLCQLNCFFQKQFSYTPVLSVTGQHKSFQSPFLHRSVKQFVPFPGLFLYNPGLPHHRLQKKILNPDSVFQSGAVRPKNAVHHITAYSPVYSDRRKLHRKCAWTDPLIYEDLPASLQQVWISGISNQDQLSGCFNRSYQSESISMNIYDFNIAVVAQVFSEFGNINVHTPAVKIRITSPDFFKCGFPG